MRFIHCLDSNNLKCASLKPALNKFLSSYLHLAQPTIFSNDIDLLIFMSGKQFIMIRFYLIIITLTLISCGKDIEPKEPYFSFDAVGTHLLSGLKLNDTLKFAGSNGSNREYRVFKIEKTKQSVQDCSWNFGTCVTFYYYDLMKIYYTRTDSSSPNSPLTYSMTLQMQLPEGIDKKNIPKGTKAKALVWGNAFINYNKIPTQSNTWISPYINYPDFYSFLQTATFSNSAKTYNEVVVIKSGNNSVYVDPLYGFQSSVNEVWFDKKYGFVFFKDRNGNSWSKTN